MKSLDELSALPKSAPWLLTERLVVKPDQLIKRRGKNGLVKLGVDWAGAQAVCAEWMGRQIEIEGVKLDPHPTPLRLPPSPPNPSLTPSAMAGHRSAHGFSLASVPCSVP